jgi:asparagine synthase (glutamine-hydrolysing)
MCGLAGILSLQDGPPVRRDTLLAMRDAMRKRGPDGEGIWIDRAYTVGFAHRRLAIQDLSDNGAQPMRSLDESLVVSFNGEIYNQPELRAWCESRGAHYRGGSDTETLLHLYALEGEEFVSRLRGMFAFALWDAKRQKLILARDPFGIKPLYYSQVEGQLRFSSQVKSLIAGGVPDEIDSAGLVSFLTWGYVSEPFTWRKSVASVPAGTVIVASADGSLRRKSYSDPLDTLRGALPTSRPDDLREAVLDSVKHHLLSDVPVGVFLSAGVDSGTLLSLSTEASSGGMHAVTIGFDEFHGTLDDEVPVAREVARRLTSMHTCVTYSSDDFAAMSEELFAAMDQPTVDGVNSFLVSRAAANEQLKVALSGLGGDELFGGYPAFSQVPRLAHQLKNVSPRFGRAFRKTLEPLCRAVSSPKYAGLFEYGGSVAGAYLLRRALFMPWEIAEIVGEDVARDGLERLDILSSLSRITSGIEIGYHKVMALEHAVYLRNCLLRDSDWAGMAHSLEIRTPLVDTVLFGRVGTLRGREGGATKQDFAGTPRAPLLAAERSRPKTGFNIPFRQWVTNQYSTKERGQRGWARIVMQEHGFK